MHPLETGWEKIQELFFVLFFPGRKGDVLSDLLFIVFTVRVLLLNLTPWCSFMPEHRNISGCSTELIS